MKVIFLLGNLVDDPDENTTKDGEFICEFRVAVDGHSYAGGERHDTTDYYDVKVYGRSGENCFDYLHKGSGVALFGNQVWDEYELVIDDEVICWPNTGNPVMRPTQHVDATWVKFL